MRESLLCFQDSVVILYVIEWSSGFTCGICLLSWLALKSRHMNRLVFNSHFQKRPLSKEIFIKPALFSSVGFPNCFSFFLLSNCHSSIYVTSTQLFHAKGIHLECDSIFLKANSWLFCYHHSPENQPHSFCTSYPKN